MRSVNSTYGYLIVGGVLGGYARVSEEIRSAKGLWFGWMGDGKFVSGNWEAVWSLMGKVSLFCSTPDTLCDCGQVIP